jgi:tetratricopeptide (TPR) repeat protein
MAKAKDKGLAEAIEAARANPADEGAWDRVEQIAGDQEKPDDAAAAYREALTEDLDDEQREALAERAVRFHEEWYAEDSPVLVQVLERVLELLPRSDWAFQRLTVVHTTSGRWDDLLALYDRAIDAAEDEGRMASLLDEAVNVAKDFASVPDKAIDYLLRLMPLRPGDAQLSAQLERLLEREERWEDLIGFWRTRLERMRKKKDVQALRVRIARTQLDKLGRPDAALEDVRALIDAGGGGDEPVAILEAIGKREDAPDEVRREALSLLKSRYAAEERDGDVVRTLDAALALAGHDEKIALHREAAERLTAQDPAAAAEHWAALLELEPSSVEAASKLRGLAERTGAWEAHVRALETAADASEAAGPRIALRVDAADVRKKELGDTVRAVALYQQVLAEREIDDAVALKVARRLVQLLDGEENAAARLAVLERLIGLEPEVTDRRAVIGQAARAAEELGDADRALAAWKRRLADDDQDLEALGAMAGILEKEERCD